jgi:ZIP family zinc transporter
MAAFVTLGAFLMTPTGGWTAPRVTDRRHLVRLAGPDLLPEALRAAEMEVLGVTAALLLFVAGFLHPARSTVLCTIAGAAFVWLVVGGPE